jgi:hypothetical protein
MKRNMDLVRHILIKTAEATRPFEAADIRGDHPSVEAEYHAAIMGEAGLLDVKAIDYTDGSKSVTMYAPHSWG